MGYIVKTKTWYNLLIAKLDSAPIYFFLANNICNKSGFEGKSYDLRDCFVIIFDHLR